jgi:hypothetical protein
MNFGLLQARAFFAVVALFICVKTKLANRIFLRVHRQTLCSILATLGLSFGAMAADSPTAKPASSRHISGISLVGGPIIVLDHLTDHLPDALPDSQATAWKNADGTVNLTIPWFENYRMQGPDLEHLTVDSNKIFSSENQASDTVESHYNYWHWFLAPYTLDGENIYVLTHTEWYACVLVGDCDQGNNQVNSWETSNNSFVSRDGGATWTANGVNGNQLIAAAGDHWTGSRELELRVYRRALNHSGLFLPSRLIKEGNYYYSIGDEIHRNFGLLNRQTGEAPIDEYGYVLIRTSDFTNPSGWEAWFGGSVFHSIRRGHFKTFLPQVNGSELNASQVQLIYDVNAQTYIVIFTLWGTNGPVYYMTTNSLAAPSWSEPQVISGTATFQPDPRGPSNNPCNTGFGPWNYVSDIDSSSAGMNFEFTSGSPWMFYVVNPVICGGNNMDRDVYRVQLSISYQ